MCFLFTKQLNIEWGNDHDTYPQFLGAFVGALYGPQIFKTNMQETIARRVRLDYDVDIDDWFKH